MLRRTVACTSFGLLASLAVAVAAAVWSEWSPSDRFAVMPVATLEEFPWVAAALERPLAEADPNTVGIRRERTLAGFGLELEEVSSESGPRLMFSRSGVTLDMHHVTRVRAGWPLACLQGWRADDRTLVFGGVAAWPTAAAANPPGPPDRVATLVRLSPGALPGQPARRFLPYGVRPLALAGNVLVFGAAAWVTMFVAGRFAGALRRRGGRCAACGYGLHGAASACCPECGAAILADRGHAAGASS